MRILYVLNSASMDGASISFLNLLKGIKNKGEDCYVVIPNKSNINNFFIEKLNILNVPYYKLPVCFSVQDLTMSNRKNIKQYLKKIIGFNVLFKINSYLRLYLLLKKINPDIVHTNVGIIHEPFILCKRLGIRHVWHLREYQDLDFKWKILPSFDAFCKMLKCSCVITITDDIRRHFCLEKSHNAKTIYNGIFDSTDVKIVFPKEKYFLCASRISAEKGFEDVVNAFAVFYKKHKDYKLLIAGKGDEEYVNVLKKIAKSQQCSDAVEFFGYCKDVRPLMWQAKALIVASYYEGFGRMTAEAAFCGCLVIGRNTGGTKEILDYTGGFLFEGDFKELAKKMEDIDSIDEKEYFSIISESQRKAVTKYSNESYIENVYEMYIGKI